MPLRRSLLALALLCASLAGCGGTTLIRHSGPTRTVTSKPGVPSRALSFPSAATKNTTRVGGNDPVTDAAMVALAVFPSAAPRTHPTAVALVSRSDWPAALAASVLMGGPIHAPLLFSDGATMPPVSAAALSRLAPTGSGSANGAQVIRIGNVPKPSGLKAASINGASPFALAANIDKFAGAIGNGRPSSSVVIASGTDPGYAMPAAGWAAESGDPMLFVTADAIPAVTRQALLIHQRPHIYVLGPSSVISDNVLHRLRGYGSVKRIGAGATGPVSSAVTFAAYRDPPCPQNAACAHIAGSFGWAIRSPGHGFTMINAARPLDAAAAAPLSGSGSFGPELLIQDRSTLPSAVQNYFLDYATPGYTQEGPIAAVYNHGWVIGDTKAIAVSVQAQVDNLLEAVPQK